MSDRRLAFVFPGQGSQFVGMGADVADHSDKTREIYATAEEVMGANFSKIVFEGPDETLKQTVYTQPAVITFSAALVELLRAQGVNPAIVAGHSLGEYTALYAAGMIGFRDLLQLVKLRAELMQKAGEEEPGCMAAIMGLDDAQLAKMCEETNGQIFVANFNAPGQTVVSGHRESMDAFLEKCRAAGAKRALPLPVSGAFHCPMMKKPSDQLASAIDSVTLKDPAVPVVMNADGKAATSAEDVRAKLQLQMTSSVQWIEITKTIGGFGVDAALEIGPGKVLAGLIKRINKDLPVHNVGSLAELQQIAPGIA